MLQLICASKMLLVLLVLSDVDIPRAANRIPDVSVYVAPGAKVAVRLTGLNHSLISDMVQNALIRGHIECIEDNAVLKGRHDFVAVRLTKTGSEARSDGPVIIEIRVGNGHSLSNHIIRWQARKKIAMNTPQAEVLKIVELLLNNLVSAYNSPTYKVGRKFSR